MVGWLVVAVAAAFVDAVVAVVAAVVTIAIVVAFFAPNDYELPQKVRGFADVVAVVATVAVVTAAV